MRMIDSTTAERRSFSGHRPGEITFRRLLQGNTGRPDAYELSVVRSDVSYYTPRHRHNFDQLRLTLTGVFNYAPNKDIKPGCLVYFPEGGWYGPQRATVESDILLIQYGGASGDGLMTYDELAEGYRQLSALGSFDAGYFVRHDDPTGRTDGYEAIYEHMHGQSVQYRTTPSSVTVHVDPEALAWEGTAADGVDQREAGAFGERGHRVWFWRFVADTRLTLDPVDATTLLFVTTGRIDIHGTACTTGAAIEIRPGERVEFHAPAPAEVFATRLHSFADDRPTTPSRSR